MPNLNVKGETPKPSSGGSAPSGGGGSKLIITILIVVVVLAGAAFILNTTGVVKLWGKKKAQPVVMNLPVETTPAPVETAPAEQAATTPAQEYPAVEENKAVEENLTKLEVNAGLTPGSEPKKTIVTGTGMYTIQISSWTTEEMANKHAKIFADGGYESFVERRGSYYRVCIGRFESKSAAREASVKMEHQLESMPVISTVGK